MLEALVALYRVYLLLSVKTLFSNSYGAFQGEEYKLFWPDQQEFVRMAARFGATIVPFGVVGEDDVAEVSMWFCFNFYLSSPMILV